MESTEMPSRMMKSLLITITVSHPGMMCRTDSVMKELARSALSAIGSSRRENGLLVQNLARNPSRAVGNPCHQKHDQRFDECPLDEKDDDDRPRE